MILPPYSAFHFQTLSMNFPCQADDGRALLWPIPVQLHFVSRSGVIGSRKPEDLCPRKRFQRREHPVELHSGHAHMQRPCHIRRRDDDAERRSLGILIWLEIAVSFPGIVPFIFNVFRTITFFQFHCIPIIISLEGVCKSNRLYQRPLTKLGSDLLYFLLYDSVCQAGHDFPDLGIDSIVKVTGYLSDRFPHGLFEQIW